MYLPYRSLYLCSEFCHSAQIILHSSSNIPSCREFHGMPCFSKCPAYWQRIRPCCWFCDSIYASQRCKIFRCFYIQPVIEINLFNIAIIVPVELSYTQGPILSVVSGSHLITAAVVAVMNLLVIAGLRFRQRRKVFGVLSWYAPVLIVIYVLGAYALFSSGITL